ncbi:hypothetical protein MLD38_022685 [Melastoma candidum]|uniref:Uncharacterized protein n=1 Tax=Melastoma candidum TaxID=119954 RepID=A0ACB9QNH2_9MYRT|nr:hypothetical protein MLD38_022685 [Melastoma candidum]
MAERERERERERLAAERGERPHQLQVHPRYDAGIKGIMPEKGPSASKVLAVLAMLPAGGTLLALAGITFFLSLVGLMITTPIFILFSPILVPAAITVGLAVTGFLTSGAFGLTALSSLSRVANYVRQATGVTLSPEQLAEQAKRRMQETAGHVGQKTKEVGQQIQTKAQEGRT